MVAHETTEESNENREKQNKTQKNSANGKLANGEGCLYINIYIYTPTDKSTSTLDSFSYK